MAFLYSTCGVKPVNNTKLGDCLTQATIKLSGSTVQHNKSSCGFIPDFLTWLYYVSLLKALVSVSSNTPLTLITHTHRERGNSRWVH